MPIDRPFGVGRFGGSSGWGPALAATAGATGTAVASDRNCSASPLAGGSRWRSVCAPPRCDLTALAPVVRALSSQASLALRESIDQQLAQFRVADQFVLPSRCWGVLAIR